ncbi:MFS transporter [Clostridiaceae bacterium 35-E11]
MDEKMTNKLGYKVVASSFMAVFVLFGYRSTFSVLLGPMKEDLGWSVSALSTGYSMMMIVYAITAFFSGLIIDKWGTKPCYALGAVGTALGFLITSRAHTYLQYLLPYAIFAGIGTGMLWVTSTVSVRKWYVGKSYATMWGIAFAGAPLAQVVLSLGLKKALVTLDWRIAMRGLAVVVFVALILASLLAKRSPEHYGMTAVGENPAAKKEQGSEYVWELKEAFSKFPIWGTIICFCTCVVSEFLVWTQIVNFWTQDIQLSLDTATYLYVIIGVSGLFTMPLLGIVADKIVGKVGNEIKGRKIMLLIAPLCGIAAVLSLLLTGKSILFAVIACILFACYWAIEPGGAAGYAGAIYGRKTIGKIWGFATLIIMGIGPALGSFMGGYLFDVSGNYKNALLFAAGSFVVSAACAMILPLTVEPSTGKDISRENL